MSLTDFLKSADSIRDIIAGYRQFDFASAMPRTRGSPFWRYFRGVKEVFTERGETASAIFTNVIRCAAETQGAGQGYSLWSIDENIRRTYLDWQKGLLTAELRALAPTLIVFVSGPYYDDYLTEEFEGLEMTAVEPFDERVLSRLRAPGLGDVPAYRTYHPGYLNRVKRFGFGTLEAAIRDAEK